MVELFNDEAVKGTDAIEARPGFSALLDRFEANGVRVVLVEDASRLARTVLVARDLPHGDSSSVSVRSSPLAAITRAPRSCNATIASFCTP